MPRDWQDKQFKKEEAHSIRICLSLKTTLLIDSVSHQYQVQTVITGNTWNFDPDNIKAADLMSGLVH